MPVCVCICICMCWGVREADGMNVFPLVLVRGKGDEIKEEGGGKDGDRHRIRTVV